LGNGKRYIVDLGNPIIDLANPDFDNIETLRSKKDVLKSMLELEQENIVHRNLGIKYYKTVYSNITNQTRPGANVFYEFNTIFDETPQMYKSVSGALVSLLIALKVHKKMEEIAALKPVLKKLPEKEYYRQFKEKDPDLFDWVE
jgi:hypothetical protein